MADDDLQNLTAQIVSGYLIRNSISPTDIPPLISTTAAALQGLGKTPTPVAQETALKPAVPIRRSVTPDAVVCLICGTKAAMLKRHLRVAHGMTGEDYRKAFQLPPEYPLVSPNYAAQRSELARATGLGTKGGRRKG